MASRKKVNAAWLGLIDKGQELQKLVFISDTDT
jgi:hypothetical protein